MIWRAGVSARHNGRRGNMLAGTEARPPKDFFSDLRVDGGSSIFSLMQIERRPTRRVKIGSVVIGHGHPIAVQSMCATRTQDIDATVEQTHQLQRAGAE